MIHEGLIGTCVYEHVYEGLSSAPKALNDLAARKKLARRSPEHYCDSISDPIL